MTSNALIGIAGVHYIVSELSRRGLIALPTIRNTQSYDIIAASRDGTWHANIQVKASSKKVSFFPMPNPERVCDKKDDYYVLLRWLEKEQRYDIFLLTGREARKAVDASIEYQNISIRRGTMKKAYPCIYVSRQHGKQIERWRCAWKDWMVPTVPESGRR